MAAEVGQGQFMAAEAERDSSWRRKPSGVSSLCGGRSRKLMVAEANRDKLMISEVGRGELMVSEAEAERDQFMAAEVNDGGGRSG